MDLFHAITQEIESVLSCHWLTEFRDSHRSHSSSRNSSRTPSPSASREHSPAPETQSQRSSSVSRTSSPILSRASSSFSQPEKTTHEAGNMSQRDGPQPTKMMDTEPGGEQTQYEGSKGLVDGTDKQSGTLGGGMSNTAEEESGVDAERAQKTTENIRYGQNISESGVGGFTNTSDGTANQEGGYGGTTAQSELEDGGNSRTSQGYTPKDGVHDNKVGG